LLNQITNFRGIDHVISLATQLSGKFIDAAAH